MWSLNKNGGTKKKWPTQNENGDASYARSK